jgi:hypothetical protein
MKKALRRSQRVFCPHCAVYVGQLRNGLLDVGFVLLNQQTSRLQCPKCSGDFYYYQQPEPVGKPNAPDLAASLSTPPDSDQTPAS